RLFLFCVIGALLCGYLFLRYSTPVYRIHAKVLVKDDRRGGDFGESVLQDLGIERGKNNVENEIEIFKSLTLMKRVVSELNLNIRYAISGRIKSTELYHTSPFKIEFYGLEDSMIRSSKTYKLKLHQDGFLIYDNDKEIQASWGEEFLLSGRRAVVTKLNDPTGFLKENEDFVISVVPVEPVANVFKNALSIQTVNNKVSIVELTISDVIPKRGEDILDRLREVYMKANVDDKNRIAGGTMEVIDDRLDTVFSELSGIEKEIERFKKSNEFTDLGEQSKNLLSSSSSYMSQLTEKEVQLSIVESLETHIKKDAHRVVPSTLLINDPNLSSIIEKYNNLQLTKQSLLLTQTENSPYIQNLDQQLAVLRSDM